MKNISSTLKLFVALICMGSFFVSCEESNDDGLLDGVWTVEEQQESSSTKDVYEVTISTGDLDPSKINIQNFLNLHNSVIVQASISGDQITIPQQDINEDAFKSTSIRLKAGGDLITSSVFGSGTYDSKNDVINLTYTHNTSDGEVNEYTAIYSRK